MVKLPFLFGLALIASIPNTVMSDEIQPPPVRIPVEEDIVNEPPHYVHLDPEPIAVIEAWELPFHEAQVLKYLARYRHKNGKEDLEKAKWYLERLIDRI